MLDSMSARRASVAAVPHSMNAVQHSINAVLDRRDARLGSMNAADELVKAGPSTRNRALDSMGDACRSEATRHASVSGSARLLAATHRLESAARPSPAGNIDCETAQPGALSSDRRIVNPSCRRQSREGEIEADGRESMRSDPASVRSDRAPVRADRVWRLRAIAR
jgi:hypothetical protein